MLPPLVATAGPNASVAVQPLSWCLVTRSRGGLFLRVVVALPLRRDPRADADAHLLHYQLPSPAADSSYLLEQPDNLAQFLQLLLVICCLPPCFSHGLRPMIIV